jgi:hypothetical protein
MVSCPKCGEKYTLKQWWTNERLQPLLAYQARFVANNGGKGVKHTVLTKYIQSERLIRKCGFYDEVKEAETKILLAFIEEKNKSQSW